MNDNVKSKLREILIERFNLDITLAKSYFSTQNFAFVFPNEPYMLRVSLTSKKTRDEILSELIWLDDLKQFKQTICQPNVSLNGKLLEEFEIDGQMYRASMFLTAKGGFIDVNSLGPMFFICVGDLLGTIHNISTDERQLGMNFKRKTKHEDFLSIYNLVSDKLPKDMATKILEIGQQILKVKDDIGYYGICHGDFHLNNFFVEENNIWVFDFDSCGYANYLYDIASFIQSCFFAFYGKGKDLKKVLYDEILYYFKIGYEINKKCNDDFWDDLEIFIKYRTAITYMALYEVKESSYLDRIIYVKNFCKYVLTQDDIIFAMQEKMNES